MVGFDKGDQTINGFHAASLCRLTVEARVPHLVALLLADALERLVDELKQLVRALAAAVQLDVASSDLRELSAAAAQALQAIFRTGYGYKKAAVMLTRIEHGSVQGNLITHRPLHAALYHIAHHRGAVIVEEVVAVLADSRSCW